jgi:hypothetical protein
MATSTTNLGLIKPAGTDKIRIAQINSNMDVIDTKMGAVGNTPLQTQITTLNTTADAIESGIAILATGNTHAAITSGQYVFVRNHTTLANGLYKASANIAANAALSTSNLTAVSGGGLNSLKASVDTLNNNLNNRIQMGTVSYAGLGQGGWSNRKTITVQLLHTMPHANYFACAVMSGAYADYPQIVVNVFQKTTTSFDIELIDNASGSGTVDGVLKWMAIATI